MKCYKDKRRKLEPWSITFGCNDCHYSLNGIDFADLTKSELEQVKEICNYYIKKRLI